MSWVEQAREAVAEEVGLQSAYRKALPAMEATYGAAGAREQARIEEMDTLFHEGDTEPLIQWAHGIDPALFAPQATSLPEPPPLPAAPGNEALMELPSWADDKVWHGTSEENLFKIALHGIQLPPADLSVGGDPDYGWEETWRDEVWGDYEELHETEQRRLAAMLGQSVGRPLPPRGDEVSLFWVSRRKHVAQSHGVPCQVNLSLLRYYWWFRDEVLGEQSYVFVCPVDPPQAPPELLTPVGWP